MKKFLLVTLLTLNYEAYTSEVLNVYEAEENKEAPNIKYTKPDHEFTKDLLTSDKIHNLTNNIRKNGSNLERNDEPMDNVECIEKFKCYFNSTMQALHASPSIRRMVENLSKLEDKKNWYISGEIKEIFDAIENGTLNAHIAGAEYGQPNDKYEATIKSVATRYANTIKKFAQKLKNNEVEEQIQIRKDEAKEFGEQYTDEDAEKYRQNYKLSIPLDKHQRGPLLQTLEAILNALSFEARDRKYTDIPYGFIQEAFKECEAQHKEVLPAQMQLMLIMDNTREKRSVSDNIRLYFTLGVPQGKCKTPGCTNKPIRKFSIKRLPKVLIAEVECSNPKLKTEKKLTLRDMEGIKEYELVSTIDGTYTDDPEKGHAIATIRLADNSWITIDDLLKNGVSPQGKQVEFEEKLPEDTHLTRDLLIYEAK